MLAPAFVLLVVGPVYHPQADPTRTRCAPGVGFPESAWGFGPRDICTKTPGDGLLTSPVFNVAAVVEYRHDPGAVLGTRRHRRAEHLLRIGQREVLADRTDGCHAIRC